MNIKRFLLILPLTFILILGLVPTVSALAADEDYFLPPGSLGFDEFEDLDFIHNYVMDAFSNSSQASSYPYADCPYYFYSCDMSTSMYESTFLPRSSGTCEFRFVYYISNFDSPIYEDSDYILFPIDGIGEFFVTFSSDFSSYSIRDDSVYYELFDFSFTYNKHTGSVDRNNGRSIPNYSDFSPDHPARKPRYIFMQSTNIPGFTLAEGVNSGGSGLNVDVRFRPGLSGEVDRMLEDSEGVRSLMSDMRMTVVNNSRTAIQYKMAIYKKNQVTHRDYNISNGRDAFISASYDDDPIFVYYSNEWVYSTDLSSSSDWYNGHVQKQNKASEWHYLAAGGAVAVRLNYSQINLVEGTEYTCIVQAVACPYDNASRMWVTQASSEAAYPEYKQIFSDDIEVVYQSDFIMTHYSDVHYDPTDTSNGVLPYSKYSDGEAYTFSYNAVEDPEGNVDYTPKNLYTDKNSWWHTQYHPNDITVPGGFSSGGSTFNNLGSTVSSFFSLITSVLGYFPSSVNTVFGLGVIALVVAGFFKAVFKS